MKIFALWFGGPSYAAPPADGFEEFNSMKDAKAEFLRRADGSDRHFPCVENSEMFIYFSDPTNNPDPYPDRLMKLGPRGGVVVTWI